MHKYGYVVFGTLWGRKPTKHLAEREELYWIGLPSRALRPSMTKRIAKAAVFKTADAARTAVNEMVNREHAPPELLDLRVGRRMIAEDES